MKSSDRPMQCEMVSVGEYFRTQTRRVRERSVLFCIAWLEHNGFVKDGRFTQNPGNG